MSSRSRGDRVLVKIGGAQLEADDARLELATAVAEARSLRRWRLTPERS